MPKKVLIQVPVLVLLSGLIAIGVNRFRPDGIPLVGDWSAEARFVDAAGDRLAIPLKEAGALFAEGRAQFLDARGRDEYARGHIQDALSLPWQAVETYFIEIADRLANDRTIITYCDGETCDLSHELALFLKEMGFADVRVLVNGWTVWRQAGLPTGRGA